MRSWSLTAPVAAVLAALLLVAGVATGVPAFAGNPHTTATSPSTAGKVTICHATSSKKNPFTQNTVSFNSIDNPFEDGPNGHGDHERDILPALGDFSGQNLDTRYDGATGAEVLAAGCAVDETTDVTYTVACDAVTADYPTGIDSIDANVRIKNLVTGTTATYNFHPNTPAEAGAQQVFRYATKTTLPAHYEVEWVQVNGTDYHWEDGLECGTPPTGEPTDEPTTPAGQTVAQCTDTTGVAFTDLGKWSTVDTKNGGANEITADGLHVSAPGNGKAAGYYDHAFDLADAGTPNLAWTGTGTAPGLQMGIDLDGQGGWDGVLVNEQHAYPDQADQWWISKGAVGPHATSIFGHPAGTLDEWLTMFPDAKVTYVGYSLGTLGANQSGSGVITSITVGCQTYTFAPATPAAPTPATPTVQLTQPVCTPVDGVLKGQTITGGAVSIPTTAGVKSAYVFNGTDATHGKPADLTDLAPGTYLVIATPQAGFTFDGALADGWKLSSSGKATFTFTLAVVDCWQPLPATPVVDVTPAQCTPADGVKGQTVTNGKIDVTEALGVATVYTFNGTTVTNGKPTDLHDLAPGQYLVIATPENGYTFQGALPEGWKTSTAKQDSKASTVVTITAAEDCWVPVEVTPTAPVVVDVCGTEGDSITFPEIEGVKYKKNLAPDGRWTVRAVAQDGYTLTNGSAKNPDVKRFKIDLRDDALGCQEPTLTGSVTTGTCVAGAPWIDYDVTLTDPDHQSTGNTASLVITDGKDTATVPLGELVDGKLSGSALWPGASVGDDGVTPTGWPGWEQAEDGTWSETDANFAWTRGDITATLEVNPTIEVELAYPDATPDCALAPVVTDEPDAEPTTEPTMPSEAGGPSSDIPTAAATDVPREVLAESVPQETVASGDDLASTGSNALLMGLSALFLVGAGVMALVSVRLRRV